MRGKMLEFAEEEIEQLPGLAMRGKACPWEGRVEAFHRM